MQDLILPLPRSAFYTSLKTIILLSFVIGVWFVIIKSANAPYPNKDKSEFFPGGGPDSLNSVNPVPYKVVFVSRNIARHGASFIDTLSDMPGIGLHSHFRYCAPGKLQILKTNGTLVTLIDGSNPTVASLHLIDVSAPDVSYDGTQLLFAGLPAPPAGIIYDTLPKTDIGAWRIYRININGTSLTQLTFTDLVINNDQFNVVGKPKIDFNFYDDIDPIWLPDGRICFSSSRAPSYADYGGGKTTNLWVMNSNGSSMHRITSERNGAERPMVDPLTGQIVFSRWWRNSRFPVDAMTSAANSAGTGFIRKSGLSAKSDIQSFQPDFITYNGWVASSINPDGTGLKMFAGSKGQAADFQMYGGAFTNSGDLIANFFPQNSLHNEGGFGGLATHVRGAGTYLPLAGYANLTSPVNPPAGKADSLWRYYSVNGFAADPDVLPDNRVIFSYAPNNRQDYGIYVMDANGANKTLIYDLAGKTELRAKAIHSRPLPPVIVDQITQVPSLYPPLAAGPYDIDGTFVFNCLNVYANGPVDMDITSAVKIGDAGSLRFYINHQRTRRGSDAELDWPILLTEMPVNANGSVMNLDAPANQPLFEQLRTSTALGYKVPTTGLPYISSTAHVAGMNYGRPGTTVTCVGCHRGHTLIPIPANPADAEFTNLAPGATVTISSGTSITKDYLIDRWVQLAVDNGRFWVTPYGYAQNQWARLKFPVSIKVKTVRLYNIPLGGLRNSTLQVTSAQVNLYADVARTQLVATQTINQSLTEAGTDVNFNNVVARVVEVKPLSAIGMYNNSQKRVGLAEIEVIASGDITMPRHAENNVENVQCDVYPNPVNDIAHLTFQSSSDGILNYTVYTTSGAIVLKKDIAINKNVLSDEKIDLSDKPAGVYIVSIKTNSIVKTVKIVKM
ncbi:MAG: T9SS type A sorting domain-containing protein [Bacteroidia bacterium]